MSDTEARAEAREAPMIAVPLDLAGDTIDVRIAMEPELLDAIDAEARRAGQTRSAFIAEAAREKISH